MIFDGLVPGLTDTQIAQALWDTKPAGIRSHGTTAANATDTQGLVHSLSFTRPTVRDVWLEFDLSVDAAYGGDAAVKQAVEDFGDGGYGIGSDVVLSALHTPVFSIAGVLDITVIRAGFAAGPAGVINLPIGSREIADLATIRIVVNS